MNDESPGLLTPDEAARLLKLSRETIYRLIKRGEVPAFRVGRSYRIRRDALLRVRDSKRETSTARGDRVAEERATYEAVVPSTVGPHPSHRRAPVDDIEEIVGIEDDVEFVRRSAGILGDVPPYSAEELRAFFEQGVADEVMESMDRR